MVNDVEYLIGALSSGVVGRHVKFLYRFLLFNIQNFCTFQFKNIIKVVKIFFSLLNRENLACNRKPLVRIDLLTNGSRFSK